MVVPHIVSLAGGAGLLGDGGGVAGVAWGRTFGEWMGIVIKNDLSCRNMFAIINSGKWGGWGVFYLVPIITKFGEWGGEGLFILFTAGFAKVYRSPQLGGNICHNNHNSY